MNLMEFAVPFESCPSIHSFLFCIWELCIVAFLMLFEHHTAQKHPIQQIKDVNNTSDISRTCAGHCNSTEPLLRRSRDGDARNRMADRNVLQGAGGRPALYVALTLQFGNEHGSGEAHSSGEAAKNIRVAKLSPCTALAILHSSMQPSRLIWWPDWIE